MCLHMEVCELKCYWLSMFSLKAHVPTLTVDSNQDTDYRHFYVKQHNLLSLSSVA